MKTLVIQGSARQDGNTAKVIQDLLGITDHAHLCQMNLSPYDYLYNNSDDDFLPLVQRMLIYDLWVFATPIYWYSMSAQMKIFWDRITDLMMHHRHLKKQLTGKHSIVLFSSAGSSPQPTEEVFKQIFNYLSIVYHGSWCLMFPEKNYLEQNTQQTIDFQKRWPQIQQVVQKALSNTSHTLTSDHVD